VCISLAYACTDEYHQTFVEGRTGTPIDVGVDTVGMALAAAVVYRRPQTPRTKPGKDAGRPHAPGMWPTEDTVRRRFAADQERAYLRP
jgi:hypothetical protein